MSKSIGEFTNNKFLLVIYILRFLKKKYRLKNSTYIFYRLLEQKNLNNAVLYY